MPGNMNGVFSELAFVHQPTSIFTVNVVNLEMCCIVFIVVWSPVLGKLNLYYSKKRSYFPFRWNMEVCGEERSSDSDKWGLSPPSPRCSRWYYTRWQCCHVTGMHPVFPAERSRMLLMLIGSFSQQAPPCAPANNKRPRCLLRLINQTNATGGTKHVCKCTWAFLTCLPVYMAGGSGGFMHLCVCVWGQTRCMDAASEWPEWTPWLNSAFHTSCWATHCTVCAAALQRALWWACDWSAWTD